MVESCLRIVPVVENTTLIERGKRKKLEKGGEMCILLHGQCVTRSCLGTKLQPSLYSLHQLTAHEKKVAENTSKQHNTDRKSGVRLPWPQRGDSPVILPSHLNRSDKLIPLGSAIGGELCIRDDIEALQSVLVIFFLLVLFISNFLSFSFFNLYLLIYLNIYIGCITINNWSYFSTRSFSY